jgi:hypothetical protein
MKKLLLFTLLVLATYMPANAQLRVDFGSFSFGATANLGVSSDYTNTGLGLSLQKFFGDHFRSDVNATYFFRNNNLSIIEFGANFHYVFPLTNKIGVYPIAGMGYSILKLKGVYSDVLNVPGVDPSDADDSEGKLYFNAGAGCEYYINESLKVYGEAKYHYISDYGRALLTVGIAYVW